MTLFRKKQDFRQRARPHVGAVQPQDQKNRATDDNCSRRLLENLRLLLRECLAPALPENLRLLLLVQKELAQSGHPAVSLFNIQSDREGEAWSQKHAKNRPRGTALLATGSSSAHHAAMLDEEHTPYLRPCRSGCSGYVNACGVQCSSGGQN